MKYNREHNQSLDFSVSVKLFAVLVFWACLLCSNNACVSARYLTEDNTYSDGLAAPAF